MVYFVKDVATTFFSHLRLDAYGNEIFHRRTAGLIDRSGMLSIMLLSYKLGFCLYFYGFGSALPWWNIWAD